MCPQFGTMYLRFLHYIIVKKVADLGAVGDSTSEYAGEPTLRRRLLRTSMRVKT